MSRQNKMIGGMVMSKRENFVFYASWLDALGGLDKTNSREFANEFLSQIVIYGVTGEIETDDPMTVGFINAMCKDLVEKSKKRHKACVENGNRGGRPKQFSDEEIISLYNEGLSEQDIADKLGCNIRTVQRAVSKFDNDDI
jgi:DNA-binding NarL/FixJ family response regulator